VPVTFTDDDGVVWDVWEVIRTKATTSDAIASPAYGSGDSTSEGRLCFLSARGKRRLDFYPRFWSVLSDAALQRLCRMAEGVSHADIKPSEDPAEAMSEDASEGSERGSERA
jgi:hypothetical protein